jgi:CubicO group peptidase (beta-lactamase class C family)
MRPFCLPLLLILSIATTGWAAAPWSGLLQAEDPMLHCVSLHKGAQERPSLDRARLEEHIDDVFGAGGSNGPGVAALVTRDGQVIAQRQYGLASLEHSVPFTPNHVVRLPYSEGREFIAIATVFMEHDGLIRLDDRVRTFFPRLPAWSADVTIRDLLDHRSGFVDEWSVLLLMHGSMANRFDPPQFLRLLYEQPVPEVQPGIGYMYSNSDYGLIRLILEEAAGEDLGGYMQRRMFDPLKMSSTYLVGDAAEVTPNHAPFYAPDGGGYRHQEVKTSPGGDYAVATTACDLALWAEAHSDSASEVSRAVARLMEGAEPIPGRIGHYAFGHTVVEVGEASVVRHEGVLEANYLTRIPALGLSVITFGNRYYEPGENSAIVDFLLSPTGEDRQVRFPMQPVAVEQLDRYAGRFVSTNLPSWESGTLARDLIQIDVSGNTLEFDGPAWGRFELVPVGDGAFSWHSGPNNSSWGMLLQFGDPEGDGPLDLVIRYNDGYPEETFTRLEQWTPSAELLQRVAGRYHSAHLDYLWTLMIDQAGELVLRAPTMPDTRLEPYQEGEFLLRHEKFPGVPYHVWIRFHENSAGEVTHLTVWNPRLMHHRFDRR